MVERSFAWLSRYRRLNTIFERSKDHLIAFIAIAFISILARRLKRLVTEDVCPLKDYKDRLILFTVLAICTIKSRSH